MLRQQTNAKKALLETLQIDLVYIATELIAREVLARILTPVFWSFVEHALTRDEQWATQVRDHPGPLAARGPPSGRSSRFPPGKLRLSSTGCAADKP